MKAVKKEVKDNNLISYGSAVEMYKWNLICTLIYLKLVKNRSWDEMDRLFGYK